MSWITLTSDDVKRSLSGAELGALRTAALASGQTDPLPTVIADVVNEIRGYIAACDRNTLGEGATIPDKLKNAALSRIRYEAFTRLPVTRGLLTQDRVDANSAAIALLRDVAGCRFAIEEPTTASTESISAPSPSVGTRTRNFTRETQDGI
jgi:hypothetical protein